MGYFDKHNQARNYLAFTFQFHYEEYRLQVKNPACYTPFEEQKQIVSKVNQLMAWCDELEKKIEKRDAYQERIMQAVVKKAI
jgi:hypothetical protein